HARIIVNPDGAVIEDLGSTNGTFLGPDKRRITRAPITAEETVYLGTVAASARWLLGVRESPSSSSMEVGALLEFQGQVLIVGRDPGCDRVFNLATVSGRHARLTRAGETILIEDLGSRNGTFVNGRRIDRPTPVR